MASARSSSVRYLTVRVKMISFRYLSSFLVGSCPNQNCLSFPKRNEHDLASLSQSIGAVNNRHFRHRTAAQCTALMATACHTVNGGKATGLPWQPDSPGSPQVNADAGDSNTIQVGIRIRPLGEDRGHTTGAVVADTRTGRITIKGQHDNHKPDGETFRFTSVFEEQNNEQLFEVVGLPSVIAVSSGYNATLLTYGQTGSGKTFTMGEIENVSTANEGVAHRMVRALFAQIDADSSAEYECAMQYVQIYCEHVHDLLAKGDDVKTNLSLREDKKLGVFVQGATQLAATTLDEAFKILQQANQQQSFASTMMNKHSSRSHSVCQIFVKRILTVSGSESKVCDEDQDAVRSSYQAVVQSGGSEEAVADMEHRFVKGISGLIGQAMAASTQTTEGKLSG